MPQYSQWQGDRRHIVWHRPYGKHSESVREPTQHQIVEKRYRKQLVFW